MPEQSKFENMDLFASLEAVSYTHLQVQEKKASEPER